MGYMKPTASSSSKGSSVVKPVAPVKRSGSVVVGAPARPKSAGKVAAVKNAILRTASPFAPMFKKNPYGPMATLECRSNQMPNGQWLTCCDRIQQGKVISTSCNTSNSKPKNLPGLKG